MREDYDEDDCDIVCQYCDESGLHWEETAAGWRLFNDDGEKHVCQHVADASDFDDIS